MSETRSVGIIIISDPINYDDFDRRKIWLNNCKLQIFKTTGMKIIDFQQQSIFIMNEKLS